MKDETATQRRHGLRTLGGLTLTLGASALSYSSQLLAQTSGKPIKLILPVSAGSGVDGIARAAAPALTAALGVPVIVENQPGAGGLVGTQNLQRSASDGLTISMVSNNHVIYPSVLKTVPFDPVADFTQIALIGATPMVLAINPKVPARNLKEFIALLKASPGKYNYASSGNGTILHLAAELFKEAAGVFSTHIPYRGFALMLQDIVGGQVDWGVGALPAMLGQIKAGTILPLCIASPQPNAAAPQIPSSAQAGLPKYLVEGWFAAIGPRGLAPDVLKRIHAAISTAFATPEVKEAMARQGNSINISSPAAATAHFRSELARYAAIVKRAGVVPQ